MTHNIPPIYDNDSKILILGSFPSVKSREGRFFYDHPQNRFWRVLAILYGHEPFESREEKADFLHEHHIALWDVIESCDITRSSDASVKNVKPNDIQKILDVGIMRIFCNGAKAYSLYYKYIYPKTQTEAVRLPSTSPANASYSLEKLISEWKIITRGV